MSINHAFVDGHADGGDASLVRPSDWNAAHVDTQSVTYYGAVGDGVTDDTVALQEAFAARAGKSLYIPAGSGDFITTTHLDVDTAGTRIFGDSRAKSRIRMNAAGVSVLNVTADNVTLHDIGVVHTGSAASRIGINVTGYYFRATRCNLSMTPHYDDLFGDAMLKLDAAYWAVVRDCVLYMNPNAGQAHALDAGKTCMQLGGIGIYSNASNAVTIAGNMFANCGHGVKLTGDDGAIIHGNFFEHYYTGVFVSGNAYANTIGPNRYESHMEGTLDAKSVQLPASAAACVYLDSTTHGNHVAGPMLGGGYGVAYARPTVFGVEGALNVIDEGTGNVVDIAG